jgi:MinD superfamily P-loop ATPase
MPTRIVINRCDLDRSLLQETERYCSAQDLEIAGRIPFNQLFRQAALAGKPAVELGDAKLKGLIADIYQKVRDAV